MDDNLEKILAIDFDGTIFPEIALARFLTDYAIRNRKFGMLLSYPLIKMYTLSLKTISKVTGYKTGETSSMSLVDVIMRKHKIPYSFLDKEAKNLSKKISEEYVNAINESTIPILIVTSEPKELVEKICKYAGIKVYNILGNEFNIEEDWIVGFNRESLLAGPRGKYYRLKLFLKDYPNVKVISVGDTISDIIGTEHYTVSKDIKYVSNVNFTYKKNLIEVIKSISQEKIQY